MVEKSSPSKGKSPSTERIPSGMTIDIRDLLPNKTVESLKARRGKEAPQSGVGSILPMRIASEPLTPLSLIEALAKNESYQLREFVAENPSAPAILLEALKDASSK